MRRIGRPLSGGIALRIRKPSVRSRVLRELPPPEAGKLARCRPAPSAGPRTRRSRSSASRAGHPSRPRPPPQEFRKVVTIVFSDLKGSTAMGEKLDSESLREVMTRYFDAMRAELERHGGVIEKFIGDAIMAVFGLPKLHEDDALRAVRAAAGMSARAGGAERRARAAVGRPAHRPHGREHRRGRRRRPVDRPAARHRRYRQRRRAPRAGSGRAGGPARRPDVSPRARLRRRRAGRAARAQGQVGARPGVSARFASARTPSGLAGSTRRWSAATRRSSRLADAFAEVVDDDGCRLVTIVGEAGCRKVTARGRVRPLARRPRDGPSWPVPSVRRRRSRSGRSRKRCARWPPSPSATRWRPRIRSCAGLRETTMSSNASSRRSGSRPTRLPCRSFSGARASSSRTLAAEQPLVVRVRRHPLGGGDVPRAHRARPGGGRGADSPRLPHAHELIERQPEWSTGERAIRIELQPLTDDEASAVADHLLGQTGLDEDVRRRVVTSAEGNPLFVEQLLSMLIDDGFITFVDGAWRAAEQIDHVAVPPTIHALLAARLDRLELDERSVIEPAAVIGQSFAKDAVRYLDARCRPATSRRPPRHAELQAVHPTRQFAPRRGGGASVPAHPHPRHDLRRGAQARPGNAARALRRVGRQREPRGRGRVRGDPRLPPGAGAQVPVGARPAGRSRSRARRGCGRPPRLRRAARLRTRRHDAQPSICWSGRRRSWSSSRSSDSSYSSS